MGRGIAPSLRGRALMWLAQREHSRTELRQKLQHWAAQQEGVPLLSDADIEQVLEELQGAGHLSDARFVESRVHARVARFGNRRIEQELRRHGVMIDESVRSDLQSSEARRASAVRAAKFPELPTTMEERARQSRFLAGRGFSADAIRSALSGDAGET